jgi:hypothetical protein
MAIAAALPISLRLTKMLPQWAGDNWGDGIPAVHSAEGLPDTWGGRND